MIKSLVIEVFHVLILTDASLYFQKSSWNDLVEILESVALKRSSWRPIRSSILNSLGWSKTPLYDKDLSSVDRCSYQTQQVYLPERLFQNVDQTHQFYNFCSRMLTSSVKENKRLSLLNISTQLLSGVAIEIHTIRWVFCHLFSPANRPENLMHFRTSQLQPALRGECFEDQRMV